MDLSSFFLFPLFFFFRCGDTFGQSGREYILQSLGAFYRQAFSIRLEFPDYRTRTKFRFPGSFSGWEGGGGKANFSREHF